jgi:hypothetical protein
LKTAEAGVGLMVIVDGSEKLFFSLERHEILFKISFDIGEQKVGNKIRVALATITADACKGEQQMKTFIALRDLQLA